ncbi:hypothetical protein ABG768_009223 [Culter alburnus]|uniref:Phosphatidylinositol-specific phospholipase C X domain-containing protein n=1 Tax=Culter alburnus TaxID=194366 RepID=A0AAW1ZMW4_CULAL
MAVPGKILCILMLLLHKSSQQEVFNDKDTLNHPGNAADWMKTLDDEKLISTLTIPGTHDSLALHGGPPAECQAWSLENQLKAGIRYFDLRVSGENLKIKHGLIYQHTTFPKAFKTIKNFLSNYSTETVLVRVKPVFFFKSKVPDLVKKIILNRYREYVWIDKTVPRIGEVRGKIVFVQKDSFELGIILSETDEKDDYIVTNVKVKEEKIKKHLEEAAKQCRAGNNSLSYSSGTSLGKLSMKIFHFWPKTLAKQINPWLYKHLAEEFEKNPKPCFGIIAMDFPGFDLIQKVIKFNT